MIYTRFLIFFCFLLLTAEIHAQKAASFWRTRLDSLPQPENYIPGSFIFSGYDSLIRNKKIALVVNHTAEFRGKHLVDSLLARGVNIKKIFAPEHGFRGTAEAGEAIKNGTDIKTGLPLISLYGKTKKPSPEMLAEVDAVLFDIQDVGARFYTYISTMKLVMEACAEQNKEFIICDRANPLGFCTGGPVLKSKYSSFVGAFPIPVVHGLTVAELAKMAKSRHWFHNSARLKLHIVRCKGYKHADTIFPSRAPSPNLRTPLSILAYPSLCLFEGTNWSVGRGTEEPFEIYGFPDSLAGSYSFTPSKGQVHGGKPCFGTRIEPDSLKSCFSLKFITDARKRRAREKNFYNSFFVRLAGSNKIKALIEKGEEFQVDLKSWNRLRSEFLLYP
jgi:hypothetical protein